LVPLAKGVEVAGKPDTIKSLFEIVASLGTGLG